MNILKANFKRLSSKLEILNKRIKNRTPEKLKEFFTKHVFPYGSVILISAFVLMANLVQAAEGTYYEPNEEVMDLDAGSVAKTVNLINPYTKNFEEDSVQVVLAMKNEEYVEKPVVVETKQTDGPIEGDRKSTVEYTVQDDDTLSKIGWRYGLKITTIKAVNGMSSDVIKPGQKIKLPPQDLSSSYLATLQTKKVAGASTPQSSFKGTFARPTNGWNMSQPFGHTSFERWHTGIDLTSRSGLTIKASASGKVVATKRGWGGGYGNHIIIDHGQGFTTLYGHMTSFSVSPGQWVNQGQSLGVMGTTGWSTGVHLHFEIRKNGSAQNPMNYL